jgi:hypothetical protein
MSGEIDRTAILSQLLGRAENRVAEGDRRIEAQREIVTTHRRESSLELLTTFLEMQAMRVATVDRLRAKLLSMKSFVAGPEDHG